MNNYNQNANLSQPENLIRRAEYYVQNGLFVIPIKTDGSKKTPVVWKPYQTTPASQETRHKWFGRNHLPYGIAIVCGQVSGNLEAIDFDDLSSFERWKEQIVAQDTELFTKLVEVETPSGGRHIIYRCSEIAGNQALAQRQVVGTKGR